MRYTLDTNTITATIKENQIAIQKLSAANEAGDEVTLNAFSYFEIKRGLVLPLFQRRMNDFEKLVAAYGVLPLSLPVLDKAAMIYQHLRSGGILIEDVDILIAATAITHNATLVTRNTKHLDRIPNLQLENWEA